MPEYVQANTNVTDVRDTMNCVHAQAKILIVVPWEDLFHIFVPLVEDNMK